MLLLKKGECTLVKIKEDEPLLLVLFSKRGGSFMHQWGLQIISLDGIYKLMKPGWPFWGIIVEDTDSHGWPVALIITSSKSKEILACGLKIMHNKVEKELSEKWKPIVKID